jgi:flagellar protein FliO/FliZ
LALCAVLILAVGIQQGIFSQAGDSGAVDSETAYPADGDSEAVDSRNAEAANTAREAERGYLLPESAIVPQEQGGGLSVWAIFRTVAVLALCAAAVYGIVYILKRKKNTDTPDDTHLKVLAHIPITVKTAAVVIAAGNRAWLAGISDNGVTPIAEITDRETVDAMLLAYSERDASKGSSRVDFSRLLRRLAGTAGRTVPDETAGIPQTPGIRRSRERLKNL